MTDTETITMGLCGKCDAVHGSWESCDATRAFQNDIIAILRSLGLGDHARPVSTHRVVRDEIIPALERLQQEKDGLIALAAVLDTEQMQANEELENNLMTHKPSNSLTREEASLLYWLADELALEKDYRRNPSLVAVMEKLRRIATEAK